MGIKHETLADSPAFLLLLEERDIANPVDSPLNAVAVALAGGYLWGVPGPLPGQRAIRMNPGGLAEVDFTARQALTANQSRACWARTTSSASVALYDGDAALTILGDSSGSVWDGFGIHAGKVRFCRFNNSTWQTFESTKSVNDGRWHHIGFSYDSSSRAVLVYVDGAVDGSGTVTAHQAQGGLNRVGRGFAADHFDGDLCCVEAVAAVLGPDRFQARWLRSRPRRAGRPRLGF